MRINKFNKYTKVGQRADEKEFGKKILEIDSHFDADNHVDPWSPKYSETGSAKRALLF